MKKEQGVFLRETDRVERVKGLSFIYTFSVDNDIFANYIVKPN